MELITPITTFSNTTCRICLKSKEETNSINDFLLYEDQPMELIELIKKVSKVEVTLTDDDALTRLCCDCTNKLISSYELICEIINAEKIIKNYKESKMSENESDKNIEVCSDEEAPVMEIYDCLLEKNEENLDSENEEKQELACTYSGDTYISDASQQDCFEERRTRTSHSNLLNIDNKVRRREPIGSRLNSYTNYMHQCNQCKRVFAKVETLERHKKQVHTYASQELIASLIPLPTKERPIQCDLCHCTFKREDTFKRHFKAQHPETFSIKKDNSIQLNDKDYRYKRELCPFCGRCFSKSSLIIHIRRHTGEKPYKCDMCEKAYPRRQDLILHQRQHTGERPHVCTVCGKAFIGNNKLVRHMRVHTGQRPYKCTECKKSFAQSNDLKIHMRRHTGEKPYICEICNEGFICGAALSIHRKQSSHFVSHEDTELLEISLCADDQETLENANRAMD